MIFIYRLRFMLNFYVERNYNLIKTAYVFIDVLNIWVRKDKMKCVKKAETLKILLKRIRLR